MNIECVSVSEAHRLIYQLDPRRLAKEICKLSHEVRDLRLKNKELNLKLQNAYEHIHPGG